MRLLDWLRTKRGKKTEGKAQKGLSVRKVDDYLQFVIFLAIIGLAYIWNSHYAEKQMRMATELEKEVKDLKSKSLMKESTLSAGTRFSEIREKVDSLGLYKLNEPAYKIIKEAPVAEK